MKFKALAPSLILLAIFHFALMPKAFALVLPDPSETFDGLPVSQPYDEFFSYSTQLLTQFGYAGFDIASGTGNLDIVLMTGSPGTQNDPVTGGFTFEAPVQSASGGCPTCSTFSGTWGAGLQSDGPVTVDQLLSYLRFNFGPTQNIPVFTFDLAEPGDDDKRDLEMVANFMVWDPVNDIEVESWSIDNNANGVFDPTEFITVQGLIELTGLTDTYSASNTGSGKFDFLVFAPTMNLSLYSGQGYQFRIFSEMRNLEGRAEEATISSAVAAPQKDTPVTPEPSTIILTSIGMMGFLFRKRISS